MSLVGHAFVGIVIVLTIAAFVAVIVLWPRLAVAHPARVSGRAALLLGLNLLVLLAIAVSMNARFLFFAGWSDVVGALSDTRTVTTLSRGASAETAASARVSSGQDASPALPASSAEPGAPLGLVGAVGADGVVTTTITGRASGITARVVVRLPPGYLDPANATVRYPVLVAFAGYPGDAGEWLGIMNLGGVLDETARHGGIRAPIIVLPQLEIPKGRDTECVNGSAGRPQVETWVAQDVPDWIAATFRVALPRTSWATLGLSAGGWCAAMTAALHPARFSAAIVMGGYFEPDFGPAYVPYSLVSPLQQRYDLITLVERSPPPVALWLETSHADALSYRSSIALLRAVRSPMAADAVVLQHARHSFEVWRDQLPRALDWLGANDPGFQVHPGLHA